MMSEEDRERIGRELMVDGRKSFKVEVKPKLEYEGMDGDVVISFTRDGYNWMSFRLWKEEIDVVIKALQDIKDTEGE